MPCCQRGVAIPARLAKRRDGQAWACKAVHHPKRLWAVVMVGAAPQPCAWRDQACDDAIDGGEVMVAGFVGKKAHALDAHPCEFGTLVVLEQGEGLGVEVHGQRHDGRLEGSRCQVAIRPCAKERGKHLLDGEVAFAQARREKGARLRARHGVPVQEVFAKGRPWTTNGRSLGRTASMRVPDPDRISAAATWPMVKAWCLKASPSGSWMVRACMSCTTLQYNASPLLGMTGMWWTRVAEKAWTWSTA